MTADQKTVLELVGNAGGRMTTTSSALVDFGAVVTACTDAGWLVSAGGYLLLGTAGENALAAALAAG